MKLITIRIGNISRRIAFSLYIFSRISIANVPLNSYICKENSLYQRFGGEEEWGHVIRGKGRFRLAYRAHHPKQRKAYIGAKRNDSK